MNKPNCKNCGARFRAVVCDYCDTPNTYVVDAGAARDFAKYMASYQPPTNTFYHSAATWFEPQIAQLQLQQQTRQRSILGDVWQGALQGASSLYR